MAQAQGINFHFIRKEKLPNSFLLKETHGVECFCLACRSASYMEKFIESSERELGFYQTLLDFMRKKRCRRVFVNTLRQITHGKAYKDKCLEGSGYVYWKAWAKTQLPFKNMLNDDLEALSRFLGACSSVYENWSTIVANLTDPAISPDIDASTFSVEYFQKAISSDWCLEHNSSVRGRYTRKQGFDLYEDDKFKDILSYIIDSGILLDLDHYGPHVSHLGSRLTRGMLAHAKVMKTL